MQFLRLTSFIVSEDIISVIVHQNFTINVTGIVLESLCHPNIESTTVLSDKYKYYHNTLYLSILKFINFTYHIF